jgi:hypothetical protein
MDQSDDSRIQGKLLSLWHWERRLLHVKGICLAMLLIVGLVLFDLLLDWLLELPGWMRLALLCLNIGSLCWLAYRHWWMHLRSFDPLRMSLAVERLHPKLNSLLVTYLQLQASGKDSRAVSRELITALRKQAIDAAVPLDFRGVVDFRRLRKPALAAVAVLLLFLVSTIFIGPFYRVLAYRMSDFSTDLGYPTRTHIDSVTPQNLKVRRGDPIELAIQVALDSEVPVLALLEISHEDGPWETVDVANDGKGVFAHRLSRCTRSFVFRFRAGDAKTKAYAIDVVPPPQIVESLVTLRFPKYTGKRPKEISSLSFEALEGSTIDWEIRCDQSLAGARLVPDAGEALEMKVDAKNSHIVRLSMPARNSLAYAFRWTEFENGFVYEEDARRSIRVTEDETPLVELLPPKPSENATLNKSLTIRFRARDDFGLVNASIVYSLNGKPELEHALGDLNGSVILREVDWKPVDWVSGLKEGDYLTYAITVTDNYLSEKGPNVGRSAPLKLSFLTREDYTKTIQQTRDDLFNRIKAIQEDEIESSSSLKALKSKAKQ